MEKVHVKLIGLGDKDASREDKTVTVKPGETVKTLWKVLQLDDGSQKLLAAIDPANVLVYVNGRAIHLLNGWDTALADKDRVVYMRMAFGG